MSLLTLQPIVRYPRRARADGSYLLTIDLTHTTAPDTWPYAREEYALTCVLDTGPWFRCSPLGDATVILHRFGGSYGAARFRLQALGVEGLARLRLTFVSEGGMPVKTLDLDNIRVAHDLAFTPDTVLGTGAAPPVEQPAEPTTEGTQAPPPRTRLTVPLESNHGTHERELPLKLLVLGDFTGRYDERPLGERRITDIHPGNFESVINAYDLWLDFKVANHLTDDGELSVQLRITRLEDFDPPRLVNALPVLKAALAVREFLGELRQEIPEKEPTPFYQVWEDMRHTYGPERLFHAISSMVEIPPGLWIWGNIPPAGEAQPGMFEKLFAAASCALPRARVRFDFEVPEEKAERLCLALAFFCRYLVDNPMTSDKFLGAQIEEMQAELAQKIRRQIDAILHHTDFQALEAGWRSLAYLVSQIGHDNTLVKLSVLDVRREELNRDLTGTIQESGLYLHIYQAAFDLPGGEPYTVVLCLHEIGLSDLEALHGMASLCEMVKMNYLASVSPEFFGFNHGGDNISMPIIEKVLHGAAYEPWHLLRHREAARYLSLCFPRIQLRATYDTTLGRDFEFTERLHDMAHLLWGPSAVALVGQLITNFRTIGWPLPYPGSPLRTFWPSKGIDYLEAVLPLGGKGFTRAGFLPLIAEPNALVFPQLRTLAVAGESESPSETGRLDLSCVLLLNRLCQCLRIFHREFLGTQVSPEEIKVYFLSWLQQLVAKKAPDDPVLLAAQPLQSVSVSVVVKPDHNWLVNIGIRMHVAPGLPECALEETLELPRWVDQSS